MQVSRKFLLVIIDGCNVPDMLYVMEKKKNIHEALPKEIRYPDSSFKKMREEGIWVENAICGFPSVTISEHACILTGAYQGKHGIVGLDWYYRLEDEYVRYYYGGPDWISRVEKIFDIVYSLNQEDLNPGIRTIHDFFEESGSVYEPIYRNSLYVLPPSYYNPREKLGRIRGMGGWFRKSPFSDEAIMALGIELLKKKDPEFLVIWLPETDGVAHKFGPGSEEVRKRIALLDDMLADLLRECRDRIVIITSDHGMSRTKTSLEKSYHVNLATLLSRGGIRAEIGGNAKEGANVVVAPNGRAAHIYLIESSLREPIINILSGHESIDQIFYKEVDKVYVHTKEGKRDIDGFEPLRETLSIEGRVVEKYPNGVERIRQLFSTTRCGDLVITAREGYDFAWEDSAFLRGSHGSLYYEDSRVPLMIYGAGKGNIDKAKTVDIMPTILSFIGKENPISDGRPILLKG